MLWFVNSDWLPVLVCQCFAPVDLVSVTIAHASGSVKASHIFRAGTGGTFPMKAQERDK